MTYLLLLINILLLVLGQVVWKMGLNKAGLLHWHNIPQVLSSPLILLGIACYALATVVWLAVLSRLPLSAAYPLQSLAYVFGLCLAWFWLGEAISLNRWIGSGIIIVGVLIVSMK